MNCTIFIYKFEFIDNLLKFQYENKIVDHSNTVFKIKNLHGFALLLSKYVSILKNMNDEAIYIC